MRSSRRTTGQVAENSVADDATDACSLRRIFATLGSRIVTPDTDKDEESRPDIYVTRSGRRSKPPERLIYDANTCLLRSNEHIDEEAWCEQYLIAYKASTDPDTMYHHRHHHRQLLHGVIPCPHHLEWASRSSWTWRW